MTARRWYKMTQGTFKETLGVLLVQGEQLSGSLADLGQGELDSPHLTLVPEPILT